MGEGQTVSLPPASVGSLLALEFLVACFLASLPAVSTRNHRRQPCHGQSKQPLFLFGTFLEVCGRVLIQWKSCFSGSAGFPFSAPRIFLAFLLSFALSFSPPHACRHGNRTADCAMARTHWLQNGGKTDNTTVGSGTMVRFWVIWIFSGDASFNQQTHTTLLQRP